MKIVIQSIDQEKTLALNEEKRQKYSRFNIAFSSAYVNGEAYLYVVDTKLSLSLDLIRDTILLRDMDLGTSVESVRDFRMLDPGPQFEDSIVSIGHRGGFEFTGRLVHHLHSGEGSIIHVGDASITLYVAKLPPYALEVPEGNWVRFTAEEFGFWLT